MDQKLKDLKFALEQAVEKFNFRKAAAFVTLCSSFEGGVTEEELRESVEDIVSYSYDKAAGLWERFGKSEPILAGTKYGVYLSVIWRCDGLPVGKLLLECC